MNAPTGRRARPRGPALAGLAAFALGCSPAPPAAPAPAAPRAAAPPPLDAAPGPTPALAPMAWLAGRWASDDGTSQETWTASGGLLVGVGFRAEGGKTAFWEAMSVDADDGLLRYRAMPAGREATPFEAEDVAPGRAAFDNAAHDSPKRVVYERRGERLGAQLFDGGERPSASFAWGARPPSRAPELEAADRRLDADAAARGPDAWLEAFAARGVLVRRGRRAEGMEAVRRALAPDFRGGASPRRTPTASGWSPARDAGFTVGRWRGTRPGEGGEPAREARGTYLSVWTLDGAGRPRLAFDAGYDDAPPEAPAERPLFRWPTPDGWRTETIALPPEFAPDMALRGLEEVRFAPRFFDPSAETYFSYAFAWVYGGELRPEAGALAEQLRRYFNGLMAAVGAGKGGSPAAAPSARLRDEGPGRWAGVVSTVDAFGDGRPLRLNVEAEASECGGKRVVLFLLSPRAAGDAVWGRLRDQRRLFRCKAP